MDHGQRFEALLEQHAGTFFAAHPAFDPTSDLVRHQGQLLARPAFWRAYLRWLRANAYLTREEFMAFNTLTRQAEDALHNQAQH